MMTSCMTKLQFLPEPNMIFKLCKLPHVCCLFCIEFSQALLMPYERFVMLLKSRSRTHHPHMHYTYTGGRRKNMPFHLSTQKCFTPTLGVNTKNICPIGYPSNNCSKVLIAISQSFVVEKKHVAMQKLFIKKEELRKKWTSV